MVPNTDQIIQILIAVWLMNPLHSIEAMSQKGQGTWGQFNSGIWIDGQFNSKIDYLKKWNW